MDLLKFYEGKRVFLTGHSGFKGAWMSRILAGAGALVTGFALEPAPDAWLFDRSAVAGSIHSLVGDVRDLPALKAAFDVAQPEIVFHMAAQPIVRESYRNPAATYEVNVMGTVNILECLRLSTGVHSFVNVTTDKVYENKEWQWGYRENENLCGFDPYSNSKSCSELVTYSYMHSFFHSTDSAAISTARSGNVIGGGDNAVDRIVPDCIRAAKKGESIIIRNPHSTRPYQHVLDCLYGYLLLAKRQFEDPSLAGSYNFGPGDESCVTTGRLADLFCTCWGYGLNWENRWDGGPHEANFLRLDCTKARQALGWRPQWTIETAILKTVEFARETMQDIPVSSIMERQIQEYFSAIY